MRRERPQYVFFAAHLPEVEPIGIEILQPAERPLAHEFAQRHKGGMVLQQVADHQPPVVAFGQRTEGLGLRHGQRQRLFDKDMLSRLDGGARQRRVMHRRRGDRDRGDRLVAQHRVEFAHRRAVALAELPGSGRIGVADCRQRPELGEVPHEVLAPITAADHGDRRRLRPLTLFQHPILPAVASRLDAFNPPPFRRARLAL